VVSVEGIPVVELGMYSRWPRSLARAPGESIEMIVDRDGARVRGTVVYRERPGDVTALQRGASFVGLAFLWIGTAVLFFNPTVHAARLAVIGLVVGMSLPGPDLGTLNGVRDHLQVLGEVLFLILLVRFFLLFPKPRPVAHHPVTKALLFGPWLALLVCLIVELVGHPRFYHSFGGFLGLLFLGYLLALLAAVVTTVLRTPRAERRATGVTAIVVGFLVVLVPNGVALSAWLIPGLDIPFAGYFPLLIAVIPLAMALGISRHAPEVPGEAD
jgi:hypothetical protein